MSSGICFCNSQGGLFKIGENALLQMRAYVQDDPGKAEAGGVLLGRFIVDSADIVVDQVTIPMPGDKRSRHRFFREAKNHQAMIDRRWNQSKHRCNYLGGWHTHPEPNPTASKTDIRDWKRALRQNQFDSETLYFVIVGTQEVSAWEGNRHTRLIKELMSIPDQEN
ncbi:MAG: Mov34/MPN/PAD-1 family protein [Candidatus Tritonobacter lacicola]|nr:Mov34/MPN/PAD-1 family protein [Candidatus Tritonobacter lacicola]